MTSSLGMLKIGGVSHLESVHEELKSRVHLIELPGGAGGAIRLNVGGPS